MKGLGLLIILIVGYGQVHSNTMNGYFSCSEDIFLISDENKTLELRLNETYSKSVQIMTMIDRCKDKTKEKILSVLLEVELNCLESIVKETIALLEDVILEIKRSKSDSRSLVDCEEKLQAKQDILYFISAWKRDYCRSK